MASHVFLLLLGLHETVRGLDNILERSYKFMFCFVY